MEAINNGPIDGGRQEFLRKLDAALALAEHLGATISKTFNLSENHSIPDFEGLSIEERFALGDAQAADLYNLAFSLDPIGILEQQEAALILDNDSLKSTLEVISTAKSSGV